MENDCKRKSKKQTAMLLGPLEATVALWQGIYNRAVAALSSTVTAFEVEQMAQRVADLKQTEENGGALRENEGALRDKEKAVAAVKTCTPCKRKQPSETEADEKGELPVLQKHAKASRYDPVIPL